MPLFFDKLIMCASGEEMKFIDCFTIDIGMLSQPAALPDWNWFAIVIISSSVAKFKKIVWRFQIKQMFVGYAGLYSLGQVWPNVRKILTN